MRYIDAFNHFSPKRYFDALLESPHGQKDLGKRVRGIPALFDLELRLKVVDQFPDYTQILSLGLPMLDRLWGRIGCRCEPRTYRRQPLPSSTSSSAIQTVTTCGGVRQK